MIKKGDFVELQYIGRLRDSGQVFEVTNEEDAKKAGVHNQKHNYGPVTVCVGENFVVQGFDSFLVGKQPGKYSFTLSPEQAFGRKRAELIQLVPAQLFLKKGIQPAVGLRLDFDGAFGEIRSISGGRVLVDFNHPLAGRDVSYEINVLRIVDKDEEKIKAVMDFFFGDLNYSFKDGTLTINIAVKDSKKIEERIQKILPAVKKVIFEQQSDKKETGSVSNNAVKKNKTSKQ